MKDLKRNAIRGGVAKVCAQAVSFLLRLGSLVVLARLLEPKDFGLVGMVTAVTGVLSVFKDFGFSTITVQRETISYEQLSTLFWLNMVVGAALTGLTLTIAPLLVRFYQEPRLFALTAVLAFGFIVSASGVQHGAFLERQMRFGTLAVIEVISQSAGFAVGIGLALFGYAYWALVGMALAVPAAYLFCVWNKATWRPGRPRRELGTLSMVRFGGTVTLNVLVAYITFNLDKALLGHVWGPTALGLYGRAYQLINIPTESLNSAIGGVAFSALSRLQDDHARLRRYFLDGYTFASALTIPFALACAVFADDIISTLLGQKWNDAVLIFRLLAPTILVLSVLKPIGWLLYATGNVGRSLNMALVTAPLVILGYVAGMPYGAAGVALGFSLAMLLSVVPMTIWATRETVISARDVWLTTRPPLLSAVIASGVGLGARFFCGDTLSSVPRLVVVVGVVVGSYFWLLFYPMGQRHAYMDLLRDLRTVL